MKMKGIEIVLVLLLAALKASAADDTCAACKTAYTSDSRTDKCKALVDYITCLDKVGDGCKLEPADADMIKSVNDTAVCTGSKLTDTCKCQKKFWGAKGDCAALPALKNCTAAVTATEKGCDKKTATADIFTNAKTRLNCTITTTLKPNSKGTRVSQSEGVVAVLTASLIWVYFS